jgi:hypothetical protein
LHRHRRKADCSVGLQDALREKEREPELVPKDLIESIFVESNMSPAIQGTSVSGRCLDDKVDQEKEDGTFSAFNE